MPDLLEGESLEIQGSAARPYLIKHSGGVYSCSCPAWRNQSLPIDRRTCKHLRKLRGEVAEAARVGEFPQLSMQNTSSPSKAPPLLLAETWTETVDPRGWWLSEKLDGVRTLWTGTRFLSRQGNVFHAPAWFIEHLPSVPLDGELWLGRQQFPSTVSIVRRQNGGEAWRDVRFVVFDAPQIEGPFETRQAQLRQLLGRNPSPFATVLDHAVCRDRQHLAEELTRIEAVGGEGLMLRQPGSQYVPTRSTTLLKVKSFRDGEATVIGHQPGAGRHRGRLGALLVRLASGIECTVGTGFTDAQREAPPAIGSIITLKYQELTTAGRPRFPVFVRVRPVAAIPTPHRFQETH